MTLSIIHKGVINGQKSLNMNSKNLTRNVLSTVFSFFTFITMTLFIICSVVFGTILNPHYINYEIKKSNYCERILKSVNEEYESIGNPGGFDSNVMTHLVDLDQVKKDVFQYTDVIFGEKDENVVAVGVYDQIYQKLKSDIQRRGIKITEEIEESLQYTSKCCYNVYLRDVKFPFVLQLRSFLGKLKTPVLIALLALLAVNIFLIIFIFLINPRNKRNFLRYVIYSLLASSLFLVFISIAFFSYGKISRLAVYEVLYYFLMSYINDIFLCFLICSFAVFLALGLAFVLYKKTKKGNNVAAKHMK